MSIIEFDEPPSWYLNVREIERVGQRWWRARRAKKQEVCDSFTLSQVQVAWSNFGAYADQIN